jgi:hypothetical protein
MAWWIPTGRPSVEAEAPSSIGVAVVSVPADRHVQELVRLGRRSVDAVVLLAAGKAGFLLVAPPLPYPFHGLTVCPLGVRRIGQRITGLDSLLHNTRI